VPHAALQNIVALNSSFSHVATIVRPAVRTAPAVGAGIAASILIFLSITRRVRRWLFLGVVLFDVALIIFGLSISYLLSMVALTLLSVGDMISVYIHHLLVQLETPDHIRGRASLW
jgi:presenilin-like A22 family membrane protease